MLDNGALVNDIADDGSFALGVASQAGHSDIVLLLLQHGAEINLQDQSGKTGLIAACESGRTKVVKILLEHGANTSLMTKNRTFALRQACVHGHYAIVKLLIKHNADVNLATDRGFTSLMVASFNGRFNIVKLLLEAGANTRMVTKDGSANTVTSLTKIQGHNQILLLLSGRPTVKEAFIALLPLAAKWKTIGFLLDLNEKSLARIKCSTDEEALREMLGIWVGTEDPDPSWEALAEAIDPLDENIAKKITSLCK